MFTILRYRSLSSTLVTTYGPLFFGSNFRSVGNFKRAIKLNLQTNHVGLLRAKLDENRPLSIAEWQSLRSEILTSDRQFNEVNIDATVLGFCIPLGQLTVAKSYIAFLKEIGIEPNVATTGRLLRLYGISAANGVIDDQDRQDIINIYDELMQKSNTYDASTCENLIHALVLTNKWLETLQLLDSIKVTAKPTASAYSCIAARAFQQKELELGWRILNECVAAEKIPKCEVFLSYIDWCGNQNDQATEHLIKMLQFIELHEIIVSRKVIDRLRATYETFGYVCAAVEMGGNGRCPTCRTQMRSVHLTNNEFNVLSSAFLQKVLLRSDTFLKSSPTEVAKFQQFLEKFQPFDCVIDGLNVAYGAGVKKSPVAYAKLLALVVKYFADHKKRLLVLGRRHMLNWPKPQMNFIQQNAKLFLTDNLSQDDPFLLYATLKSGPATDFVSRDLMRGHAYLLGADLKPIFRRWQQEHQYYLAPGTTAFGQVRIQVPIKFQMNAHTVDGIWHIPYTDEYLSTPPDSFDLPRSWLCISSKQKR